MQVPRDRKGCTVNRQGQSDFAHLFVYTPCSAKASAFHEVYRIYKREAITDWQSKRKAARLKQKKKSGKEATLKATSSCVHEGALKKVLNEAFKKYYTM
eukprot:1152329-Pelagomonas_calceolata.AAC.3